MKTIFESENIRFVEVSEALVGDYLTMVNDLERVERFLGGAHEPFTEEQEIAWVHKKLENREHVFSLLEKESGEFIGNIELMDVHDSTAELGVAITGDKQDLGCGTEAIRALCAYGFERLGLKTITLRVFPENVRAIHVYQKCGFVEYDRTDEDVYMQLNR